MFKACNFGSGTPGNTLETTDVGDPDPVNAMTGVHPTYVTDHFADGSQCVKFTSLTTAEFFQFTALGTITSNVWARFYLFLPSLPADNNFYPFQFRTSADVAAGLLRVLSSGSIQMRDNTNSQIGSNSVVPVPTNQLVRIETRINTGAGQMEYWLYTDPTSTVEADRGDASGATLGADIARASYGHNVAGIAAGLTSYWDAIAVSDVGKIGPLAQDLSLQPRPLVGRSI